MGAPDALTASGSHSSHTPTGSARPTLAIVIPICNESSVLEELFARTRAAIDGLPDLDSQVIYVNDGSTDTSLEMMLEHRRGDPRFTVIDLSGTSATRRRSLPVWPRPRPTRPS